MQPSHSSGLSHVSWGLSQHPFSCWTTQQLFALCLLVQAPGKVARQEAERRQPSSQAQSRRLECEAEPCWDGSTLKWDVFPLSPSHFIIGCYCFYESWAQAAVVTPACWVQASVGVASCLHLSFCASLRNVAILGTVQWKNNTLWVHNRTGAVQVGTP